MQDEDVQTNVVLASLLLEGDSVGKLKPVSASVECVVDLLWLRIGVVDYRGHVRSNARVPMSCARLEEPP